MQIFKLSETELPRTNGVYALVNTINGKIYIGSTSRKNGFYVRGKDHRNASAHERTKYLPIYKAISKYGVDSFEFWILEECEPELCLIWEQYCLDTWTPWAETKEGYNICKKAGSLLGFKHSEETKRNLSIKYSGKNHPNYGKTLWTPEQRKQISEARKGAKSPHYGKKFSEETRKKMSESMMGNTNTPGKTYIGITPEGETIIFTGAKTFCRNNPELNLRPGAICRCANGGRKHHRGWQFKYYQEEEANG